ADTPDFMKGGFQTQVPVQPRTGRPPTMSQRRFETIRNTARFVMEQLPAQPRGTALITTNAGMNYDIKDIESAYALLSAPLEGAAARAEAGSFAPAFNPSTFDVAAEQIARRRGVNAAVQSTTGETGPPPQPQPGEAMFRVIRDAPTARSSFE